MEEFEEYVMLRNSQLGVKIQEVHDKLRYDYSAKNASKLVELIARHDETKEMLNWIWSLKKNKE
jgi:hypothetical protein